jgi:5-methylthioadenosine/S-adenosylhomocysteine deaminase
MEECLVIRDGIVVTMDPAMRVLNGATVVVAGDRIVEISDDPAAADGRPGAMVIDASGCAVIPGLVNCHGHLRPMRAQGEGMDVRTWHTTVVDGISERMSHDDAYAGAANAYAEMLLNGITTSLAMSIVESGDLAAARDIGIRARIVRHAVNREELESALALAEGQGGSEADRARLWLGMDGTAFYTDDELALAGAAMERSGLPLHTHFCEYRPEPVDRLEQSGMLRKGLILAHAVHVSEPESARLAAAGASVAHNVKSNMKFSSGAAPIRRFISEGIDVGIGTDGPLSTFACDVLEETRTATMLARVLSGDPAAITTEQALAMATRMGAAALGLEDEIGSLEVGKKADVAILDLDHPRFRPLLVDGPFPNLPGLLLFTAGGRDVRDVVVDGRVVVRDRRLQTLDQHEIMEAVQERGVRLLEEAAADTRPRSMHGR